MQASGLRPPHSRTSPDFHSLNNDTFHFPNIAQVVDVLISAPAWGCHGIGHSSRMAIGEYDAVASPAGQLMPIPPGRSSQRSGRYYVPRPYAKASTLGPRLGGDVYSMETGGSGSNTDLGAFAARFLNPERIMPSCVWLQSNRNAQPRYTRDRR